jgi:hypothetical protein
MEGAGDVKIYTRSQTLIRPEIERIVSDYVYTHMPWKVQDIRLTFRNTPDKVFLPTGAWKANVRPEDGFTYKGSQNLYLDVVQREQVLHSLNLAVEIKVSGYVAATRNKVKRGTVLTAEDVELTYQEITSLRYRPYATLDEAVGKKLRRSVSAGTVTNTYGH